MFEQHLTAIFSTSPAGIKTIEKSEEVQKKIGIRFTSASDDLRYLFGHYSPIYREVNG